MDGIESCRRRGLWCDGLIPEEYRLDAEPATILGRAWIGFGSRYQEPWLFRLVVGPVPLDREMIDWSALLPPDDVTSWLTIDVASGFINIDPSGAVPDEVAQWPESDA